MAKVSVIVPVYNAQKYLSQCLDSLLNQTLKETEIICVDDGSADDSVDIINQYSSKDRRVKLIRQKNSYAGVARNNGLKQAAGEYVVFVDADDFFERDMLRSMYAQAKKDNAEICLCSGRIFNEATGEYKAANHYLNANYLPQETPFSAKDVSKRVFNFVSPGPWTKLFKRDYVIKNGFQFQATKKTNDLFFVYCALACAHSITYVNEQFVNYRTGNVQSLQGKTKELNTDFYTALFALKKELQSRGVFAEFEQSFVNRALSTGLYALDRADTKENYIVLADKLRESYFYRLGVLGHSRGYFYNKNDFDKLLDLMQKSSEELWNQKNDGEKEKKKPKPGFDFGKWQPPAEICADGNIKVSVIIPVYNVETYLEECVDSVTNNSLKDIEIICVDDGSTDGSLQILKKLAEKDNRIKIISKENGGLSSARNAGLKAAAGEYVLFLDSDDYIEPRALEYLYSEAKAADLDQLFFSARPFYENADSVDIYVDYTRKAKYNGVMTGREMFVIMSENADFKPSACLQMNKRAFLAENGITFIEGIIHEDNPFTVLCLFFSERVRYDDIDLYNRRLRENSIMTGSAGIKSSYNYYLVIKNIERIAQENRFAEDAAFYAALKAQLKRISASSADSLLHATQEEIVAFMAGLDEATAIDYYCMIQVVSELRESNRVLSRDARCSKEKELMNGYKEKCREAELKAGTAGGLGKNFLGRVKRLVKRIVK